MISPMLLDLLPCFIYNLCCQPEAEVHGTLLLYCTMHFSLVQHYYIADITFLYAIALMFQKLL